MLHKLTNEDDRYLKNLGREVRRCRKEKSWSRKVLAEHSGVSERFLAQLEAGTANISLVRLRATANALGLPLHELLNDVEQFEGAGRHTRIALIGLRGAGKSTLGQMLAESLGVPFVELTGRIEQYNGLNISEIFSLYGSTGYRDLERQELATVIGESESCVMAPAGGICDDEEVFDMLLESFYTIWLTAQPQDYMDRVRTQGDLRPMRGHSQAMQALKAILGERSRSYARADAVVDTSGRDEVACCKELERLVT